MINGMISLGKTQEEKLNQIRDEIVARQDDLKGLRSNVRTTIFEEMKKEYLVWNNSVDASLKGKDYPEGKVLSQPKTRFWMGDENYKIYLEEFILRPEYERRIRKFYK